MIAPLAFLGPKYDDKLKEAYTTISTEDVAKAQVLPALLGKVSGLADTAPLKKLIARFLTQQMLDEIAVESRKGRVLLIGTTNLESQRPIIWDIGAIAESGHPQALELVREIILASASIPGAFPPVNVGVTADGKPYNEMHVDGGVTRQVFMYPPTYSPLAIDKAIGWKPKRTVYIIRNNKIEPEYAVVKPKLISVAGRSIDTLIKSDGIGDLYRIYADRPERQGRLQLHIDPLRFQRSKQVGIRQGLYGRAVRSRLQCRPAARTVEAQAAGPVGERTKKADPRRG